MLTRPLGTTGISVSPIGFGAFKIGRNQKTKYPSGYDLPDEQTVERLLNDVLDLGINYIDTAPAYGLSEERIGRYLSRRRCEFVLSSKVGETFERGTSHYDFSETAVRSSVECSLRRLQTDALDILYIHSNGDDLNVLRHSDVVATLIDLKQSGKTRCIGFSGKTVDGAAEALQWADVLMVEYHLNDISHGVILEKAHQRGVGIVVKKGLASGHLSASEAVRFVLSNPHVASLVIGGLSVSHMAENLQTAWQACAV